MLRTDFIKLINQGDVWAFVGSGTSIDSGGPTWGGLVKKVVELLDEDTREKILQDKRYIDSYEKQNYHKCFSRIEHFTGREVLEDHVASIIMGINRPGRILNLIADWPFAGYITTNYDKLLESAIDEVGQLGWIPIGNTPEEVKKISRGAAQLIWHIHGAVTLPSEISKLILTEEDYDKIYLENSRLATQLQGFLTQHRVVFIGFGLEDPEVMRLLKLVGSFCSPVRPVYAFIAGLKGHEREELLEKYNIDIIPYKIVEGTHKRLIDQLNVYNAFILRRTLQFGQPARPTPSFDPETTGLMVYNHLTLKEGTKIQEDVLGCLLKSRVLSYLKYHETSTKESLFSDTVERIKLMQGKVASQEEATIFNTNIETLIADSLLEISHNADGEAVLSLSEAGLDLVTEQGATSERLSAQFSASLRARARRILPNNTDSSDNVAVAAESFFKECLERRALGVALAWDAHRADFKEYHMVGLLQTLPDFMTQLSTEDEARILIRLVQEVLAKPSDAEYRFMGLAVQARFGVNLLGYDFETVQARARELANTIFLVDSNTLIPLLARSSIGYASACFLIDRINTVNSAITTTDLLITEVAEHARYATKKISKVGSLTTKTLIASLGRAGHHNNCFLEGFVEELNKGIVSADFNQYLDSVCGHTDGHKANDPVFEIAIEGKGIRCLEFSEWEGFEDSFYEELEAYKSEIKNRRETFGTFKQERQVKAEAEVLIIITNLREGNIKFNGNIFRHAYFVSTSRVIDIVSSPGLPITMRPEAVLQWLSTITVCNVEELGFLVDGLLWELSEQGFAIVETERLQIVFSHLVNASRDKLQEELEIHHVLVSRIFGENPEKAFQDMDDLDIPIAEESYYAQKSIYLENELKKAKNARAEAVKKAQITEKEREDLKRLREKEKLRRQKAESKRKAAKSKSRKKRRKGRKK